MCAPLLFELAGWLDYPRAKLPDHHHVNERRRAGNVSEGKRMREIVMDTIPRLVAQILVLTRGSLTSVHRKILGSY